MPAYRFSWDAFDDRTVEELARLLGHEQGRDGVFILRALERLGGNRTRTAKVLGVDARAVFRCLERGGDE